MGPGKRGRVQRGPGSGLAVGYSAGGYLVGLLGTHDTRDDSDPALAGISSRPDCVFMGAGDGDLTVPYPEASS